MKKYERVNLTSQIYRDKTRSKSPINLKQIQTSQHNNYSKSFHSVCCPNCKYLFKIPKQFVDRQKTPTHTATSRKQKHKDFQVQTQQYLLGNLVTSPKRQKIDKESRQEISSIRHIHTDRTPQKPTFWNENSSYQKKDMFNTDRDKSIGHRQKVFQITPTKIQTGTGKKQNQKISKFKQDKNCHNNLYPARSAYLKNESYKMNSKNQKQLAEIASKSMRINNQMQQKQFSDMNNQTVSIHGNQLSDINKNLAKQLMKKIKLTEQINEIIKFHTSVKNQTNIPSYCKMLMYDLNSSKQEINKADETNQNISMEVKQEQPESAFRKIQLSQQKQKKFANSFRNIGY